MLSLMTSWTKHFKISQFMIGAIPIFVVRNKDLWDFIKSATFALQPPLFKNCRSIPASLAIKLPSRKPVAFVRTKLTGRFGCFVKRSAAKGTCASYTTFVRGFTVALWRAIRSIGGVSGCCFKYIIANNAMFSYLFLRVPDRKAITRTAFKFCYPMRGNILFFAANNAG